MFQKVCAPGYSDSLRLYKLYARAQAFAPLRTDLEQRRGGRGSAAAPYGR